MEHVLVIRSLDGQEPLHSVNIGALFLKHFAQELVGSLHGHLSFHFVRESTDPRIMLVLLLNIIQELTVDFQTSFDVKALDIQNLVEWNLIIAELYLVDWSLSVEFPDLLSGFVKFLSITKVNLVQENFICEANLLDSLILTSLLSIFFKSQNNL